MKDLYDVDRRFIQMFSDVVMEMKIEFYKILTQQKEKALSWIQN